MKYFIFTILLVCFNPAQSATVNGFQGDYAISNWTQTIDDFGSIDTSGAPNSISLTSSNHIQAPDSGPNSNTDFTTTALSNALVSFDWSFSTNDGGPFFDPFGILLNGVFTQLTDNNGNNVQSGTFSFLVAIGDIFGFRQNTLDSREGSATTTISEFSVASPSPVPVPAAVWLFGTGLIGIFKFRKKSA